jgi:hypothetical protein
MCVHACVGALGEAVYVHACVHVCACVCVLCVCVRVCVFFLSLSPLRFSLILLPGSVMLTRPEFTEKLESLRRKIQPILGGRKEGFLLRPGTDCTT